MTDYVISKQLGKNQNPLFIILLIGLFLFAFLLSCKQERNDKKQSVKETFTVAEDITYKPADSSDDYEKERCKLDLYIPMNEKNFPVMVWFHGGSLKHGSKNHKSNQKLAKCFVEEGIAVAVVSYRLSPNVKYPAYIDDAAASTAWLMKNIGKYGGDPKSVFIAGHSAGGYLVYMLIMNPEYLKKYDVKSTDIAGVIPISGQTFTHYTVREERGIPDPEFTPMVDEASPCFNARKITPPILAIVADGDTPDRIAENKYLLAFLETIGNKNHFFKKIKDRTHWTLVSKIPEQNDPMTSEMLKFIKQYSSLYK